MNQGSPMHLTRDMPPPEAGSAALPPGPSDETSTGSESYAHLGMWDAISIIVGIVVGMAIFRTPQMVFSNVSGPWQGLAGWTLGGLLALIGSLCYAELATAYPRMGGDYVYLSRAFGRSVGFLFGWARLVVILTGSIGAMAYAFADYALAFWALEASLAVWFAAGSVVVLTCLNLVGVICGKTVQNILSVIKVLGLVLIIVAGMLWGGGQPMASAQPVAVGFGLAMVFVLYAYGGWNDAAYVAAEVRNRQRNIPLALILAISGITGIYLLVNGAYLWVLGFEGVRASATPAADVMQAVVGDWGSRAISLLIMLSALGAINGMIFTGARIYVSMGVDHRMFSWLGQWNSRRGTPIWSLLVQAAITLVLIVAVGTQLGQDVIDRGLQAVWLSPLPWDEYFGGFDTLVAGTAPVFWVFFLLTGLSLFVLRYREPHVERPFRVPAYPLTPIIFCLTSVYMLHSSLDYAKWLSALGWVPVAVGVPVYLISKSLGPSRDTERHDGRPLMGSGDEP